MDIGEQEARRADNQIWNAAGAYGFATGSRGYEPNGEASLYFNTAIGLVRQLYDYKKLELLFTALERHSGGELQSELLWLGLERCAYLRCRDARPALTFLQRDYAQRQLQQDFSVNSEQDRLKIGWFRRALGLPSEESDREKQILDALEFDPDWDAEAIQTRMEQIVLKYFGRNLRNEIDHFNSNRVDLGFFARLMLRPGGLHRLGQAAPEGGVGLDIGCGSGALTIACAKRNPQGKMVGIDRWGKEYASFSLPLCEKNAAAESVKNASFRRGNAVKLDFPDESFDAVTSNYVYHNITGKDKQQLLLETLRVLKKGGTFAIHDLMSPRRYGDMQAFVQRLRDMGYERVELLDTTDGSFMTPKEARRLMLRGSTLLLGIK